MTSLVDNGGREAVKIRILIAAATIAALLAMLAAMPIRGY